MYNVLTIDLDYIAEPYIQLYHNICNEANVNKQWDHVFSNPQLRSNQFDINSDNLIFALDIFSRALAKCKNVSFSITHDSILYELANEDNFNIVNIDHHHDIVYAGNHEQDLSYDLVYEGDWIEYLRRNLGKNVEKYLLINNPNSFIPEHETNLRWEALTTHEYQLEFTPDLIHVCLSPSYIPKFHWFYFKMFTNLYKAFYDGEIKFYKTPYKANPYGNPMHGNEKFLQEVE